MANQIRSALRVLQSHIWAHLGTAALISELWLCILHLKAVRHLLPDRPTLEVGQTLAHGITVPQVSALTVILRDTQYLSESQEEPWLQHGMFQRSPFVEDSSKGMLPDATRCCHMLRILPHDLKLRRLCGRRRHLEIVPSRQYLSCGRAGGHISCWSNSNSGLLHK